MLTLISGPMEHKICLSLTKYRWAPFKTKLHILAILYSQNFGRECGWNTCIYYQIARRIIFPSILCLSVNLRKREVRKRTVISSHVDYFLSFHWRSWLLFLSSWRPPSFSLKNSRHYQEVISLVKYCEIVKLLWFCVLYTCMDELSQSRQENFP